jgi:hypothetical protein
MSIGSPLKKANTLMRFRYVLTATGQYLVMSKKQDHCECPKNDTLKRRQICIWRWIVAGTSTPLRRFIRGGRTGLELSMRRTLAIAAAVLFLLGSGIANAADPAQLAETGGFLLGNARRCGVPTDRIEHAGKVIHDLIVAASDDSTEEAAADSRSPRCSWRALSRTKTGTR